MRLPVDRPKRYAIYVLGAGFSAAAGLPMAVELWREILRRGLPLGGRGGRFQRDLDNYIDFRRRCEGVELTYEEIDLEALMGFLDIEHHLGLRGSDTWSDYGNEGQLIIRNLIGQILSERTPAAGKAPELYVEFARRLRPDDVILTFNYDILLERALDQAGVAYRLFPMRFQDIGEFSNTVDNTREEVVILKVHGSVDWFDDRHYQVTRRVREHQGLDPNTARHPVFGLERARTLTPLVDGPRDPKDPLLSLFRLKEVDEHYSDPAFFTSAPSLISPSTQKLVYARFVRDFWNGLGRAGATNLRFVIIGYSLPQHDDYARQVLFAIARNYEEAHPDWAEMMKVERDPILIVDLRTNDADTAALKQRYAFVDWTRAVLHVTGLDSALIELL